MIKRIVVIGLVVVGALGGGWLLYRQATAQAAETSVQTVAVRRGDLDALVSAAGNIAAHTSDTLYFQTSGQVREILVQVGDQVKAGQTLAQLDTTDLEAAVVNAQLNLDTARLKLEETKAGADPMTLASARANLANAEAAYQAALAKYNLRGDQQTIARAQLDRARVALENARFAYEWALNDWLITPAKLEAKKQALDSAQEAYDEALQAYYASLAGINDAALRAAEAQLASARSQLDNLENTPTPQNLAIAEAQVRQAELSLKQAQLNLAKATLVAPLAGMLTSVAVQVGQTVGAGTAVMGLADMSRLEITVSLPEVDVTRVQVVQPVTVTLDALGGRTLAGEVVEVALVGQTIQNVVSYPAVVRLTDSDPEVRIGMNASLSIVVARRQNVLLVPNRAIRTTGRQRTVTVYYQGQMITMPVTVGLAGDTYSEIVSDGLREGDLLVINTTTVTTTGNRTFLGLGGIGRLLGGR